MNLLPLLLAAQSVAGTLRLEPCVVPGAPNRPARCGTWTVPEDPARPDGRQLALPLIVAAGAEPRQTEPIVLLAGGPGQAATQLAGFWLQSPWIAQSGRDVVLLDQRGTGGPQRLGCPPPADPQRALDDLFADRAAYRACRDALADRADLQHYTTTHAVADLAAVLTALGYGRVNLVGGSYGTRVGLEFLRRHSGRVRLAILNGLVPPAFVNPLPHASEAQTALDGTFADCARDAACHAAYPELPALFARLLQRLRAEPAATTAAPGPGAAPVPIRLHAGAFAEVVRTWLYAMPRARDLPRALAGGDRGHWEPFAQAGLAYNVGLREQVALGMLLSVVCSEDLPRLDTARIAAATRNTFLGDTRIRYQLAVCADWPRGEVPVDFGTPVQSDVPVLLISGNRDPVTGPRWGEEAARHLSRALHLVVPGAHNVGGACLDTIRRDALAAGRVDGLDTRCVAAMTLPPFALP